MAFRSKRPQRVLDEMDFLVKHHKTKYVSFVDNIMDLSYFKTVLPTMAATRSKRTIFFETKSNLKADQVRALAQAGVTEIQPGIESMSSSILKLMGKGVTALQNIQLLRNAEEHGVNVHWNLIYGFPGENPAEYAQIIDRCRSIMHLKPPTAVGQIRLDRFSPNYFDAERKGFANVRPLQSYAFIYDLPAKSLRELAYFFEYEYRDGTVPIQYARELIEFWKEWREQPRSVPLLARERTGDAGSIIVDRRPTRICDRVRLDRYQHTILHQLAKICTAADVSEGLAKSFPGQDFCDEGVRDFLAFLETNRFVVTDRGKFLSVVPHCETMP
jgi:ribosomal peptide maturation radical SAM protein 1